MRFLIVLFLLSLASTSYAQNSELDLFFDQYIGSFNSYLEASDDLDVSTITQHFAEPALQMPLKGAPRLMMKYTDLNKGYARFLSMLKDKGGVKLEWEKKQVVRLSDDKALASNIARILDKNGLVVDRRSSIYTLYKSPIGWKIAIIQSHAVDRVPLLAPKGV